MSDTPAIVEELAAVIGHDHARKLAHDFAGRSIYVPRDPGAAHPIAASIGEKPARQLAECYHGTRLDFPMRRSTIARILTLRSAGRPIRSIAGEVGVTERWVYRVLDERAAERSADLFG